MIKPYTPIAGMRVIYGRTGFQRTGWKGVITDVSNTGLKFTVTWDEAPENPTDYRTTAWACTQLGASYRCRESHYIFFDESHAHNKSVFPSIFNCNTDDLPTKPETTPKEETDMKKTLVKQTLVNGTILGEAHEEKLIAIICDIESNIKHLKSIKAKSTKIASLIAEYGKAVDAVVKELDSRG